MLLAAAELILGFFLFHKHSVFTTTPSPQKASVPLKTVLVEAERCSSELVFALRSQSNDVDSLSWGGGVMWIECLMMGGGEISFIRMRLGLCSFFCFQPSCGVSQQS